LEIVEEARVASMWRDVVHFSAEFDAPFSGALAVLREGRAIEAGATETGSWAFLGVDALNEALPGTLPCAAVVMLFRLLAHRPDALVVVAVGVAGTPAVRDGAGTGQR
jgi:hypothetical protein